MHFARRQSGIALITVLLVFALVTVIAAEVMSRNYRDIHRSARLIDDQQAYQFALSGEQYARQILYRDYIQQRQRGSKADSLEDNWALNFKPFKIEEGEMTISISDDQALFNINNLVTGSGVADPTAAREFRRLLQKLEITTDYTDRIIDWIDTDHRPAGDGAEDSAYDQGYLPANRPMADKTELRLIVGMTVADYLKLAPYVVALPKRVGAQRFDQTKYNINTVGATLLQAISSVSALEAQDVADRQRQGGYDRLDEWLASPQGAALKTISTRLAVGTEFFKVVVKVKYRGRISIITTHLYRDAGTGSLTVIERQIGIGNIPANSTVRS